MARRIQLTVLNREFRTEQEALDFARDESTYRKGNLYVVRNSGIYFVDQQRYLDPWEDLRGIYDNGVRTFTP